MNIAGINTAFGKFWESCGDYFSKTYGINEMLVKLIFTAGFVTGQNKRKGKSDPVHAEFMRDRKESEKEARCKKK